MKNSTSDNKGKNKEIFSRYLWKTKGIYYCPTNKDKNNILHKLRG